MVQVLPPVETFGQQFARSVGKGISKGLSEHQSQKDLNTENEAIYNETGIRIPKGLTDPEQRKIFFKEELKKKREDELQQKKEDFYNQLTGGGKSQTPDQKFRQQILRTQTSDEPTEEPSDQMMDQEPSEGGFDPTGISDEAIIGLSLMDPQAARLLQSQKDTGLKKQQESEKLSLKEKERKRKEFESDREFHTKVSAPIIAEAQQVLKNTPITKALIAQQRRDIQSGNTAGLIPFLVDKFGLEAYRDPESSRFKTASKQRFVETLHELGGSQARANQFIEQQLTAAQPALGRSEEANLGVLDLEDFVIDMKNQRAKFISELSKQDNEKYGFERRDIDDRAEKLMKDYAEKRQDEMAYDIRKRHEANLSDEDLVSEIVAGKITPDTPLTIRAGRILMIKNNDDEKKATAEAKKLGFKIPLESTYERGL